MATKALVKDSDAEVLPVRYQALDMSPAELSEILAANAGGGNGLALEEMGRIKVPAGGATTWSVPTLEGDEDAKEVKGVIIAWRDNRAFWKGNIEDSGGTKPPDCSSKDAQTGSLTQGEIIALAEETGLPYQPVMTPNHLQSCATCPFAKFGTAKAGQGRGQWCKASRQLYILFEETILPTALTVPPKSIKPIRSYFLKLLQKGLPYYGVVTSLTLRKEKNADGIAYSEIVPQMLVALPKDEQARFRAYHQALEPFVATEPVVIDADIIEEV
jgi:hypothetical protein